MPYGAMPGGAGEAAPRARKWAAALGVAAVAVCCAGAAVLHATSGRVAVELAGGKTYYYHPFADASTDYSMPYGEPAAASPGAYAAATGGLDSARRYGMPGSYATSPSPSPGSYAATYSAVRPPDDPVDPMSEFVPLDAYHHPSPSPYDMAPPMDMPPPPMEHPVMGPPPGASDPRVPPYDPRVQPYTARPYHSPYSYSPRASPYAYSPRSAFNPLAPAHPAMYRQYDAQRNAINQERIHTQAQINQQRINTQAQVNKYQMDTQASIHKNQMDSQASIHERALDSQENIHKQRISSQAEIHRQRVAQYEQAIAQANMQNTEMQRLLHHYKDFSNTAYSTGYVHGVKTLDAAQKAWEERSRMLDRLRRMSLEERQELEKLDTDEAALLSKHASIRQTVEGLLHTSASTAREIKDLRDRYARQIAGVTQQYVENKDSNEAKLEASSTATRDALQRASAIKAKVSKAMAQANYYESQEAQAQSDQDLFKQRAERAAGDAEVVRKDMYGSMHSAMDEHEREMEAIAARKVAQTKAAAVAWIMRSKDASAEDLAIAKGKLLEATTDAKVATGVAESAKTSVEHAVKNRRELDSKVQELDAEGKREQELILQSKARADAAEQRANLFEEETQDAQTQLSDAAALKKEMMEKANVEIKLVESAEGHTALAKAQARAVEAAADQENRLFKKQVADMRIQVRKSYHRLNGARYGANGQLFKRDSALEDAMRTVGKVSEATNGLTMANERYATTSAQAEEITAEAAQKKEKAAELLKNVDALAGLARQAAKDAALQNIEGFPLGGSQGGIHYPAGGGTQKIDIHVIPHSPVMGPSGQEAFAMVSGNDAGTKKLGAAGINV